VLDASAHLLSRALVSQSAVTCCTLARVVVWFVLHANIVFVIYCVNIVCTGETLSPILRYYPGICPKGRPKNKKKLGQPDASRHSNPELDTFKGSYLRCYGILIAS
jgi:hypothetical protein